MDAETYERTLDESGRVTIPKPIRERFDLDTGDAVSIHADGGNIVLIPKV